MAVGDSLVFPVRGDDGETDITVKLTEPTRRDGNVVVRFDFTATAGRDFGQVTRARFFAQLPDGTFESRNTVAAAPGASFKPDVEFTQDLDRDSFTIGVTVSAFDETPPTTVPDGQTLSVPADAVPPIESPEPVEPQLDSFDLDLVQPVLDPDEQTAVQATLTRADNTTADVTPDVALSVRDTSVARVVDGSFVEAVSFGETTVTATLERDGQTFTDIAAVTVNPPEVTPEQPQQPPDVDEFVIPLSFFNASPLFDGLQDVSFTVPQIGSIRTAVATNSPNLTDIETTVDTAVGNIDIPEPPSLSDIETEVDTAIRTANIPTLSEIIGSLDTRVQTLETRLGLPDLPDETDIASLVQSAESGVSDVTAAVDTTVDSTIETADNAFESVQSNLQADINAVQTALQEDVTAAQTTLDEIQGTAAEFDGVTLPGLQDSVDSITGDLLGEVPDIPTAIDNRVTALEEDLGISGDGELVFPTVDEFVSSVQDELIPTVTAADGTEVGLLDATPRFISIALEDFLQDALSADTKQRARERAQEGQ
jgi:hypothetical protein